MRKGIIITSIVFNDGSYLIRKQILLETSCSKQKQTDATTHRPTIMLKWVCVLKVLQTQIQTH